MATPFETEPCGRCGGSGMHSYCQRWGTTCFDCGVVPRQPGTGRRLTKRGAAARAYFHALLPTKRAADLQPGDVLVETLTDLMGGEIVSYRSKVRVLGIEPSSSLVQVNGEWVGRPDCIDIVTNKVRYCGVPIDSYKRVLPSREEHTDLLRVALDYQLDLTKAGTPRKARRGGK